MKRYYSIMAFMLMCVCAMAQQPFALTEMGATATYKQLWGKKFMQQIEFSVYDVTVEGDVKRVSTLMKILNKKGEPSKMAKLWGWGKGVAVLTKVSSDGTYTFEPNIRLLAKDMTRTGFAFRVPDSLYVGQQLECGTVDYTFQAPKGFKTVATNGSITYSGFSVVGEEDLQTDCGTIHCYKIQGHLKGGPWWVGMGIGYLDEDETYWFARGFGMVGCQYKGEMNKDYTIVLSNFSGVTQ